MYQLYATDLEFREFSQQKTLNAKSIEYIYKAQNTNTGIVIAMVSNCKAIGEECYQQ